VDPRESPSRELAEQVVVRVLQEHRDAPVEVQARAVIAAVREVDAWRLDAPTEAETASRRAMIGAALPNFERVVEETGNFETNAVTYAWCGPSQGGCW
jgi:hypothetical protein